MARERSPGTKLLFTVLIGMALILPLVAVYALVYDRQQQSSTAQAAITNGWGGPQVVSGPVLVIPYTAERTTSEVIDSKTVTRTSKVREELYLSPERQTVSAALDPEVRKKSIYETVIYLARLEGTASFSLPGDLARFGVARDQLLLGEAELRFGASDARGLQTDTRVAVNGEALELKPGNGVAASGGSGFYGFVDWDGAEALPVDWSYSLRGSRSLSLVPRGGNTEISVTSPWPHPNFSGDFIPDESNVSSDGFSANWSVANLALGQAMLLTNDPGPPTPAETASAYPGMGMVDAGQSKAASVTLIEPVDLYSQVDRSVKYGFLFIGFTFVAFLMFDIVGGARVASAEYFLTGAGLVLFFVMLLAFAEVIGFAFAYIVASAAIIGLLTAYSAAVLGSWRRAGFIGALLTGLYALLYVLLSLQAWSLMIGSILLFAALAGVMYATRRIDWSSVGRQEAELEG